MLTSFCNKRSFLLNQIYSKKLQVCASFHGLLLQKDIKGLSLKQPFPILSKVNELTAVLWKLQIVLPRHFLLSIYKAFIRPHLDCSDVIYDKIFNASWHKKLESAQYNAALARIGIIWSTNNVKLYQGLGFRVLPKQARVEKIKFILQNKSPLHLYNSIPAKAPGNKQPTEKCQKKSYNKRET